MTDQQLTVQARELQPGDVIVTPAATDADGIVVRRDVPDPLPTIPGYYVAEEPSNQLAPVVVELLNSPAGQWADAGAGHTYLTEDQVRALGPLAPLARVDEIIGAILGSPALNGGIPLETITDIAARYGVTP